ncbi:MAG TPA: dephospho-CoA kinase [Dokdonella sp.]|uniref:dephospho-CoA kinase n=1 Tax=Dokdonella sp. TaxID=2291710 RepID=UPI002D80275B|nr:dephospho-CoA kinase [Dokdonella sp.]HET9031929.1 dephospho-CoA kinase [Dokdonella sp.]
MYVVALTGGIASGKSAVERRFAARGIDIVDADQVAREVIAAGTPGLADIVDTFGMGVIGVDGELDRKAMRERVFADADARRRLEAIIHPRVRQTLRERALLARSAYVILAIPLLVESGDYDWVNRVLVIDVPRDMQVTRLVARDGITRELAESMLAAQATREQRLAIADDVLDNSGPLDAIDALVEPLHQQYLGLAKAA